MSEDSRIPVLFGQQPEAKDAVLAEDGVAVPEADYVLRFAAGGAHGAGCACCVARSPAAEALAALFRARAMGAAPYFSRVLVLASPAGEAALRAALENDALARARYRALNGPR
ncbi:MAG: hypothetical protein P4L52_05180 [Acidocella sp.]|nr:hypothetical protein [Acidocella sp.]